MDYSLAIDIGASSGRHILGHLEDGKIVTEEIYRFPNLPDEIEGHYVWNTERLFAEILNGLKRAAEIGKIPSSVGIDTWAVDYALLDKDCKLIPPVFSYRDGRTEGVTDKLHSRIPFEELYSRTGIQFQPFNTVYQLYADKLSGRLQNAEHMLMLPDYFHFLLTGVMRQEYTNATSTGMVSALGHTWDEKIIEAAGLDKKLFRPLSQPGETVGEFSDEVAAAVGYRAKVILPATHDTASAVLAAPLSGTAPYISSGTWSLLGIEQTFAHTDKDSMSFNYSNEGSTNYSFRFQKNIMGLWMIQQVRHDLGDSYSFSELAGLARANPTDIVVDANDGRFLAPESMLEEVHAAAGRQLTVGQTAYCIFNSLAKCYAQSLEELESITGEKYDTLYIIGGGCKNGLLNELTAKETGKRVVTGPSEATAIGNLVMQMTGKKQIKNKDEARELIRNSFDISEVVL